MGITLCFCDSVVSKDRRHLLVTPWLLLELDHEMTADDSHCKLDSCVLAVTKNIHGGGGGGGGEGTLP